MNHPEPLKPKEFAALLRKEIGRSRYTAREVFSKAGIPISYLYKWKSGTVRDPTPAEITHFAQILGKSPYYFLFGSTSEFLLIRKSDLLSIINHSQAISGTIDELLEPFSLSQHD